MAGTFNKVIIMGNLTRDVELRYIPSGTAVGGFSIACNEKYTRQNGEKVEEVSYFDVEVWAKQAENCANYLTKGSKVLVEGSLKQDRWEQEDGTKRNKVKIRAQNVQFMSANSSGEGSSGRAEGDDDDDDDDDNIPF